MQTTNPFKRFFQRCFDTRTLVFIVAMVLCGIITYLSVTVSPSMQHDVTADSKTERMPVSIVSVEPETARTSIEAFAEAVPLWQTSLKTQVEGPVTFIAQNLAVGNFVEKGELLAEIEKSAYRLNLAEAKSRLETAEFETLQQEREAEQAQKDWEQSGIQAAPSPLALRKPQLKIAKANYQAAEEALAYARKQVGYTEIRAPYDGVVIQRNINFGQSVLVGDEIAKLASVEALEIPVPLDTSQWDMLPQPIAEIEASVTDPQTQAKWMAAAVRAAGHIDSQNRLRTLFLRVTMPYEATPPLLPGNLVKVHLAGRNVTGLLRIPESALTKQGLVWRVDSEEKLQSWSAAPLFYRNGSVYIRPPDSLSPPFQIAVFPNTSFMNGLLVTPLVWKDQ